MGNSSLVGSSVETSYSHTRRIFLVQREVQRPSKVDEPECGEPDPEGEIEHKGETAARHAHGRGVVRGLVCEDPRDDDEHQRYQSTFDHPMTPRRGTSLSSRFCSLCPTLFFRKFMIAFSTSICTGSGAVVKVDLRISGCGDSSVSILAAEMVCMA